MTPRQAILNSSWASPIVRDADAVGASVESVSPELADVILKKIAEAGLVIVQRDVAAQAVGHLTDYATSAAMLARLAGVRPDVEAVRNDLRAAIEGKAP